MLNGLFDIDNRLDYLTENGDMLPRLKELPPLPDNNMKYELRLNHNGVLVQNLGPENKQNSGANRLDYLKDSTCAETLKTSLLSAGISHSILQYDTASDLEFLFGIYQTGTTAKNRVSLLLYPDKTINSYIVLDNSLYTIFGWEHVEHWKAQTQPIKTILGGLSLT